MIVSSKVLVRLGINFAALAGLLIAGCTSSAGTAGGQLTYSTTPPTTTTTGSAWDPLNPGISGLVNGVDYITYTYNGTSTVIAYTQKRCNSYGDALPDKSQAASLVTVNGAAGSTSSDVGTAQGRFVWAQNYVTTYSSQYQVAQAAMAQNSSLAFIYPSFGVVNASTGNISLPSGMTPCDDNGNYSCAADGRGDGGVTLSSVSTPIQSLANFASYALVAFCQAGCYRGDQPLYFSTNPGVRFNAGDSGLVRMEIAKAQKGFEDSLRNHQVPELPAVLTLAADSVMGALSLISSPISYFTGDQSVSNPAPQAFYEIIGKSGYSVVVTPAHGLVLADGSLWTAKQIAEGFAKGQSIKLVRISGEADEVAQVNSLIAPELAHNVTTSSAIVEEHFVVAGEAGYVAGDDLVQDGYMSALASYLTRKADRVGAPLANF